MALDDVADRRLPAGADGRWSGGWAATRAPRSSRRWRDGWERGATCPPDPRGDRTPGEAGWRDLGAVETNRDRHEKRRRVVRLLRRAGYVTRWRWSRRVVGERKHGKHVVPDWRYQDGPANGATAVDPWTLAANLSDCGATWKVSLRRRKDVTLTALPLPVACGRMHLCPVCAGRRSAFLALALRRVLDVRHQKAAAPLALVTLTHRADPDEPLAATLTRFRSAWRRLTGGRRGRTFKTFVDGWYFGLEVTRGADGRHWHLHAHLVVRLRPGVAVEAARRWIGMTWVDTTEAVRPGYGWDPTAGGCRPGDWSGDWWRDIDPERPSEVYQAAKYPTPAVELSPLALAEFVAVAHGRRWHQGGGCLRSVVKEADALDVAGTPEPVLDIEGPAALPVDVGENVGSMAPNECPDLDAVAADLGRDCKPCEPSMPACSWFIADRFAAVVAGLAVDLGGRVELRGPDGAARTVVSLPSAWVAHEVRHNCAMLAARRAAMQRARTGSGASAEARARDYPDDGGGDVRHA